MTTCINDYITTLSTHKAQTERYTHMHIPKNTGYLRIQQTWKIQIPINC